MPLSGMECWCWCGPDDDGPRIVCYGCSGCKACGCTCSPEHFDARSRGNWILEVFQPLPENEARMLRDYGP